MRVCTCPRSMVLPRITCWRISGQMQATEEYVTMASRTGSCQLSAPTRGSPVVSSTGSISGPAAPSVGVADDGRVDVQPIPGGHSC